MDDDESYQAVLRASLETFEREERIRREQREEEERRLKQREEEEKRRKEEEERRRVELLRKQREEELRRLEREEEEQLAAALAASALEHEEMERKKKEREEEILREIERENERKKKEQEERERQLHFERLQREAEEKEKKLKEARELENTKINSSNFFQASNLPIPILCKNNTADDPDFQAAINESLSSFETDRSTNQLLESIVALPPGYVLRRLGAPKGTGPLIVGSKHKFAKRIADASGGNCSIRLLPRNISMDVDGQMGDCLLIVADNETSLTLAEEKLIERIAELFLTRLGNSDENNTNNNNVNNNNNNNNNNNKLSGSLPKASAAPSPLLSSSVPVGANLRPEIRRHIIVDNSNLFIGAQSFNKVDNRPNPTIRINSKIISKILIKDNLNDGLRIVAGSKPPANGKIWQYWQDSGFRVKICSRDVDSGAEDLVDEFLHAQAMKAILDRQYDQPGENTLVLCTGDGNENHGFSNFVNVAKNAAKMGWRVEIWAWNFSCSKNFKQLAQEYPDRVSLNFWNDHANQILFNAKTVVENNANLKGDQSNEKLEASPESKDKNKRTNERKNSNQSSPKAAPAPTLTPTKGQKNVDVDDDSEDEGEDNSCIICMDKPRSCLIIPCFHLICCHDCIINFPVGSNCPCCRGVVEQTKEVYSP